MQTNCGRHCCSPHPHRILIPFFSFPSPLPLHLLKKLQKNYHLFLFIIYRQLILPTAVPPIKRTIFLLSIFIIYLLLFGEYPLFLRMQPSTICALFSSSSSSLPYPLQCPWLSRRCGPLVLFLRYPSSSIIFSPATFPCPSCKIVPSSTGTLPILPCNCTLETFLWLSRMLHTTVRCIKTKKTKKEQNSKPNILLFIPIAVHAT